MDLQKIISELQAERQRLDEAILALERLSSNGMPQRGRPRRRLREADGEPDQVEANEERPKRKKSG